ncbi:hypothetical protein [Methylocaldum szegediense]|uniref:Uncharacterized protein n=1 Tax=Methylocaldum szegediense TaxID=73780 RepID=A0ABN8X4T0_9GAMM|nr:hypothetical protein [Methylocaldum szegediense]CAI8830658.1 conserved protein of unknown function [Methylocaldum szegediense]
MYLSAENFDEYLNRNAEKMSADDLWDMLDNAPAEFQGQPLYWYWQGFLAGRDSAYYRALPSLSRGC